MGQHQVKRAKGAHGPSPLSAATRKRILATLLARADAGDVLAGEALVRLSFMRVDAEAARRALAPEAPA